MFWDRIARFYDAAMTLKNGKGNRALGDCVAGLLAASDDVLECACGTGIITVRMAPACRALTATDFSEGMLAQVRRKCRKLPNVQTAQADITRLAYPDACFDKVVAGNVIHLLDDPQQALRELMRVCTPGGSVIIPTYVNRERTGRSSLFVRLAAKLGAGFKTQFTYETYQQFIRGYAPDAEFTLVDGAMPCAVAVLKKS